MKRKHIVISLAFLLCAAGGWAQTQTQAQAQAQTQAQSQAQSQTQVKVRDWTVSAMGGVGYALQSNEGWEKLASTFVFPTAELRFGYHTTPENAPDYAADFGYPTLGIGVAWRGLSKLHFLEGYMGDITTLFGFFEGDFVRTRAFSFGYDLNLGLAYTPTVYDFVNNPNLICYSSHLVLALAPGITLKWRPARHWELGLTGRFHHMSTGRLSMPNRGLNSLEVGLDVRYAAGAPSLAKRQKPEFLRHMEFDVAVGMGLHKCRQEWNMELKAPTWANFCLITSASYRYARAFSSGISLDFFMDQPAFTRRIKEVEARLYPDENTADAVYSPFSCGISAQQHIYYGNLAFWMQVGVYVYKQKGLHEEEGVTYQRIGLKYVFPKLGRVFLAADCRIRGITHAECMEFIIGKQF